jgi:hypothetical protein
MRQQEEFTGPQLQSNRNQESMQWDDDEIPSIQQNELTKSIRDFEKKHNTTDLPDNPTQVQMEAMYRGLAHDTNSCDIWILFDDSMIQ